MSRDLSYTASGRHIEGPRGYLVPDAVLDEAIQRTNTVFEEISAVAPYIYALLGMRNLSAFVGAVFAQELATASAGMLMLNPHQDGYPDLLLLDAAGQEAFARVGAAIRSKEPFSPFPTGGLEIKATCGDVPSDVALRGRGLQKPQIGEPRIDFITSLNWKAHHRATNHLIGLVWDFYETIPAIAAVTFSDALIESDWGKIVQPREGGGRTTSVSIMARSGVQKMLSNAVRVVTVPRYETLVKRLAAPGRRPSASVVV